MMYSMGHVKMLVHSVNMKIGMLRWELKNKEHAPEIKAAKIEDLLNQLENDLEQLEENI